jgi:diacylglycerol O-acyltransferase / wax synthase
VHKLAGLDAGFLYNETPRAPQHIASVQVLELPPGTPVAAFIGDFKRQLAERAHLVPYFTNKLQFVPLQLDHPVWVRAEHFDIDDHVRHVEVPQPGSRKEFEAVIAALHAQPLDRSKPLWEIWVLSGLEGGRIAYYHRVHHACLDGVSGQNAIAAIMDVTPEPRVIEPPASGFARRPTVHSAIDMLIGACENMAKFQIRQASRALDHAETLQRLWQRIIDPTKGLGAVAEQAPGTRFNRAVHRARTYATGELSLADVKAIGKATSTTINDVFLAVCSGALRRYLGRRGELPEKSLKAGCPVSLRQRGDDSANNQVTMMMVSFATDEADPVKRLLKIGRSSRQAKGFVAAIAGSYDADLALPGLPGLAGAGAGLMESAELADRPLSGVPCNVVVSNVPGPRQQLYSLGARVLTHYPVSIPAHGQAVNITVQSYMDQLFFGVTACAKALPDADALRDDMLAAYAELKERIIKAPTMLARREPLPRGQVASSVSDSRASAAA